ncbi:MAG: ATP-binding cassette domain-containing protein [Alphaproteobacteria bacterium]|nr:ATP-binding cassette domain-containing protein [Alphaproteobacteria bacterium]MDA7982764.1 ATP-binding cassette domain-containing protein [Alphaproteobacteria bacterium]
MTATTTAPWLSARGVSRHFGARGEIVALADVSLDVFRGECLAIVGESGSGKTTLANLILGIHPPTSGELLIHRAALGENTDSTDSTDGGASDMIPLPARRELRHRRAIQLVQQNPLSSLNPRRRAGSSLRLALDVHEVGAREGRARRVSELLAEVGLPPSFAFRRPALLSGGERQRVAIARALACGAGLVVLDEPTSALDVLVQVRVLRLLDELRRRRGLTYIFITHDLSVVRAIADRVAVFDRGRCVELSPTDEIFRAPRHPRTRELLSAVPVLTEEERVLRARLAAGTENTQTNETALTKGDDNERS